MKKISIIILAIVCSGCTGLFAKEAPQAYYIHDGKRVMISSFGGCWEYGFINITSVCYDVGLNYNQFVSNARLIKQSDNLEFHIPLSNSIKQVTYSVYAKGSDGEFFQMKTEEVDGNFSISLKDLPEGSYVIDTFVKWSSYRDTYYITGVQVEL